ncbi:SOS response-associated peptidase family protein [Leptospira bandrabouensis]|uniref:SOS response-associated peptidase family protein n=1 Tax=Leptospira bandrabouensis TaxID=2484903 RepID=UPI001FCB7A8F|nr:SOS response-associated peptidase family protein [Leptospira bandrabouensis]
MFLANEPKEPWFNHLPKETIDEILKQSGQVFEFKYPKSQVQSFQLVGESVISSTDHWGTKPSWCPDLLTNTKSEKLIASPFWGKFTKNRILVPVHSFVEWQAQKTGKKHKFEITFKNPNTFFAGIWGEEDGQRWITILTQVANEKMKTIHNSGDNKHRQPVVMPDHFQDAWLDPKVTNPKDITDLLYQFAPDETIEVDHNREETLFG